MKKISIMIVSMLMLTACYNFDQMNTDPNYATKTNPSLLLTNMCWTAGSNISKSALYATRCLVQTDGENREQYYKWDRGSYGFYANMRDVTKMQEEAERVGSDAYRALALFFRAYYLYDLALTFGDIPYTQALQGEGKEPIYNPAYSKQEDVFKGILDELKTANELLATEHAKVMAKEKVSFDGDIFYGGDAKKWQRAVNALRLKILMSLSKKATVVQVKEQFSDIVDNEPLMQSVDDNAQLVYINQQGNRYSRFNDSDFGSGMYMSATFIDLLKALKDPRLFTFCTRTPKAEEQGLAVDNFNAYDGGDPTAPYKEVNEKATKDKTVSKPSERFYEDPTNEPSIIMGYAEQELILAEAATRGWIAHNAADHYKAGVMASFQFYQRYAKDYSQYLGAVAVEAYLQGEKVALSSTDTQEQIIEKIMVQRYIPSFFQCGWTAYFNYLRTGYPAFKLSSGMKAPLRWMYPQSEYNNNTANVNAAITSQFGKQESVHDACWWLK